PDPDAVARLVEATMIPGVERVGVVGAKIVDWDRPRVLRDVGRSADRFGHPFSSLQPDELDQGQFDRVLEVLSVDSCAMLVAREVWQRLGTFDERLGDDDGDLDLCWRVRIAGWRVLMTPLARVRHRGALEHERPPEERSRRYEEDRAAIATVVKNYSWWSLVKVLPVNLVLAVVRLAYLAVSRRFEEAYELLHAWWWNVAHLRGTLARRRLVQRERAVPDRALRRFTESAGLRLPRWFQTAERIFEEQRGFGDDEAEDGGGRARLRQRTASLVASHPVAVAATVGVIVGAVAFRDLLGPEPLVGGALPTFPTEPGAFLTELVSATRTTGLGGPLAASPALGALAGLSYAALGSVAIAQKALVVGAVAFAAVLSYRAAVRVTGHPAASVLAAAAYTLSGLVLWALSDGRLGLLVAIAIFPPLVERVDTAFRAGDGPDDRRRLAAGLAVTLAVGVASFPGALLPWALVLLVHLALGRARWTGLVTALVATAGAAVLLFPFVPTLAAGGGAALGSTIGSSRPDDVLRLVLGGGPGTWIAAWFVPVAAALGLALVRGPMRAPAWRAAAIAALALALAWLSSAGWLPAPLGNAPAYLVAAAVGASLLIAYGLASTLGGLGREAFGFRQVATLLLVAVLASGVFLQSIAAMTGRRAIGGPDRVPAALAVLESATRGSFRVLWVGARSGRPFPPPGGDPAGVVEAGPASVRYTLTDRDGASALDVGRPLTGPGADALRAAIGEILAGGTVHGGALLAPFGVRYVVAAQGDLPEAALERFDAQVDLDVVPAASLRILRNAAEIAPASAYADDPFGDLLGSGSAADLQALRPARGVPLQPVEGGWAGRADDARLVVVSTEFDDAWRVDGGPDAAERAFGWATALRGELPADVRVRYGAQLPSTVASIVLAALWAAALWITRRPVPR
ncbi:MAG TPA: hypothetical protein VF044_03430, partial [Actinomycetota bacterium]